MHCSRALTPRNGRASVHPIVDVSELLAAEHNGEVLS